MKMLWGGFNAGSLGSHLPFSDVASSHDEGVEKLAMCDSRSPANQEAHEASSRALAMRAQFLVPQLSTRLPKSPKEIRTCAWPLGLAISRRTILCRCAGIDAQSAVGKTFGRARR